MAKWRSFRCTDADADAESAEPVPGPRPRPGPDADAAPGACALRAACELDGCTASAFCTTRSRRALCWKLKCIRTGTGTRIRIRIHIHTHTHSQSQSQSHLAFTNLRLFACSHFVDPSPLPASLPIPPPLYILLRRVHVKSQEHAICSFYSAERSPRREEHAIYVNVVHCPKLPHPPPPPLPFPGCVTCLRPYVMDGYRPLVIRDED